MMFDLESWGVPFNRTFFNVTLGGILEREGKQRVSRLTLYLLDGSLLEVATLEDLSDLHMVVRAYPRDREGDPKTRHLIPYATIYRIEIAAHPDPEDRRLGFRWSPVLRKGQGHRKTSGKTEPSGAGGSDPVPMGSSGA
jgi:hypothetical protein